MDLLKRDVTIGINGRQFSIRAYHDGDDENGACWHTIIIENRTPLRYDQGPETSAAAGVAEAVRYLIEYVEPSPRATTTITHDLA